MCLRTIHKLRRAFFSKNDPLTPVAVCHTRNTLNFKIILHIDLPSSRSPSIIFFVFYWSDTTLLMHFWTLIYMSISNSENLGLIVAFWPFSQSLGASLHADSRSLGASLRAVQSLAASLHASRRRLGASLHADSRSLAASLQTATVVFTSIETRDRYKTMHAIADLIADYSQSRSYVLKATIYTLFRGARHKRLQGNSG